MQGSYIWNTDYQVSTCFQTARTFMHYPKKFFNMLKNLVCHYNINAIIWKWQRIFLYIERKIMMFLLF